MTTTSLHTQPSCVASRSRPRQRHPHSTVAVSALSKASLAEAYRALGLPNSGQGLQAVRRAYVEKMKLLHPDVNYQEDTTPAAAVVTVAYQTILEAHEGDREWLGLEADVFDCPSGPASELFINPFACNISPLDWEMLQQVAGDGGQDPQAALLRAGLAVPSGAVQWLTPAQRASIAGMLEAMEEQRSFESTAWAVTDCLLRAQRANARMPLYDQQ